MCATCILSVLYLLDTLQTMLARWRVGYFVCYLHTKCTSSTFCRQCLPTRDYVCTSWTFRWLWVSIYYWYYVCAYCIYRTFCRLCVLARAYVYLLETRWAKWCLYRLYAPHGDCNMCHSQTNWTKTYCWWNELCCCDPVAEYMYNFDDPHTVWL